MTLFWSNSIIISLNNNSSLNWMKVWRWKIHFYQKWNYSVNIVGYQTFSDKGFDCQLLYTDTHTLAHTYYGLWDQSGKDGCSRVRQDTGKGQAGPISSKRVQIPSARHTDCVPEKPNSLGQRTSPGRCDFVWLPRNFLDIKLIVLIRCQWDWWSLVYTNNVCWS